MKFNRLASRVGLVLTLLVSGISCVAVAASTDAVNLRFYGRVNVERRTLSENVRDLVIHAESEAKAKLWQSKFISDLTLDGIAAKPLAIKTGLLGLGDTETAFEVPAGAMAAVRCASDVHLLHALDANSLAKAILACDGDSHATVPVPLAMDALEKHAFRFYYRLGASPEGVKDYDETKDLDFCKENGLGIVFWTGPHWADTAAGVMADDQWGYLLDYARRIGLPVSLNFNSAEFPSRDLYAADMNSRQPGFMGGFVRFGGSHYGGAGHLSVDHPLANAHQYAAVQQVLRRYDTENVIGIHEVNGELRHGNHNVFLNYGPEADRSFRAYQQAKYGKVYAERFPEIAEFAGYGPKAQDLAGRWRIKYTKAPTADDFAPGLATTAEWGETPLMPGSDLTLFMKREPAVLKRTFDYRGSGRVWLYLWDLNKEFKATVAAWLNGRLAKQEPIMFNHYHWMYVEVTDLLKSGENTLALNLPWGMIGYKVYLTHEEPKFFPYASAAMNRLWLDTVDWNTSRRLATVTDSMNAMRAVEPDKSAVLMAPQLYARQLREVARLRGGRFHDTGGMAACFHEALPMMMRGANLPFTLEPGGPADSLAGFRRMTGIYMAEAVNAIHYFIHVGNVTWNPEIRAEFLRILPALKMMGRVRQDQADVAMLIDTNIDQYFGYPWCRSDFNISFPSGYWPWRFNTSCPDYPMDALIPEDFENGLADRYRVILDCNNTIVSKAGAAAIRRWVEKGGTYVAMFQSGRHARTGADQWTLSELTGFRGQVFAHYAADGRIEQSSRDVFESVATYSQSCDKLPHQRRGGILPPQLTISDQRRGGILPPQLTIPYARKEATGTALEKIAPDAVELATWQRHGGAAIGWRPLGKGSVYTFGVQLSTHGQGHGIWFAELIEDIFRRQGVHRKGFGCLERNHENMRHFVSVNGLYDVWYAWNSDVKKTVPYHFTFEDGRARELTDVLTGQPLAASGTIPPNQFVMATSPRFETTDAAERWFNRQCGDNQGTLKEQFKVPDDGFGEHTFDLTDDWTVNGHPHQSLGLWEKGVTPGVVSNINVATRRFRVPEVWTNGTIYLSHAGMYDATCLKRTWNGKCPDGMGLSFSLDGQPILQNSDRGFSMVRVPGLVPGREVELKLNVGSEGFARFTGTKGSTFLTYVPNPLAKKVLAGEWKGFSDPLAAGAAKSYTVPGKVETKFLSYTISMKEKLRDYRGRIVFHLEPAPGVEGVMVNGQYVRRHHHLYGNVVNLDIAQFLKPGVNEIILVTRGWKADLPVAPELHFLASRRLD